MPETDIGNTVTSDLTNAMTDYSVDAMANRTQLLTVVKLSGLILTGQLNSDITNKSLNFKQLLMLKQHGLLEKDSKLMKLQT